MSVHLPAAPATYLSTATALVTYSTVYTALVWFRPYVMNGTLFYIGSGNAFEFDRLYINSVNSAIQVRHSNTVTNSDVIGSTPVLGSWWGAAMVRRSISVIELFDGTTPGGIVTRGTNTLDQSARGAATRSYIGSSAGGAPQYDGDVFKFRCFNIDLSQAQIQAEFASVDPVLTGNLIRAWDFIDVDAGGNYLISNPAGLTLTATGVPSRGPIYPANPPNLMPAAVTSVMSPGGIYLV